MTAPSQSIAWASLTARDVWAPRMAAVNLATIHSLIRDVHDGVYAAASITLRGNDRLRFLALAKKYDVDYDDAGCADDPTACSLSLRRAIRPGPENNNGNAHDSKQDAAAAPEAAECECYRTTLPASGAAFWDIALRSANKNDEDGAPLLVEQAGTQTAIMLWQPMLAIPFSQRRCRMDCAHHMRILREFIARMAQYGFGQEAGHLSEMLSWPIEWNTLHGIEEMRTPIFKIARFGAPFHHKRTLRVTGAGYPEQGASGLSFPYANANAKPPSKSKSFLRGIAVNTVTVHGESV